MTPFSLVAGYLPRLDRRPARLPAALTHRRALALYPSDGALPEAAAALLRALFADLPDAARADVLLTDEDAPPVWLGPPGAPVAFVQAVAWTAGGGPMPYHDALVLEAYTAFYDPGALVARVLAAAQVVDAVPVEVRRGAPVHRRGLFG